MCDRWFSMFSTCCLAHVQHVSLQGKEWNWTDWTQTTRFWRKTGSQSKCEPQWKLRPEKTEMHGITVDFCWSSLCLHFVHTFSLKGHLTKLSCIQLPIINWSGMNKLIIDQYMTNNVILFTLCACAIFLATTPIKNFWSFSSIELRTESSIELS